MYSLPNAQTYLLQNVQLTERFTKRPVILGKSRLPIRPNLSLVLYAPYHRSYLSLHGQPPGMHYPNYHR
jgi:hypothetical protein